MSFHPTRALFGVCFVFIALVAMVTGSGLDGGTAWLWAAAFGGVGSAGFAAVVVGLLRRSRR